MLTNFSLEFENSTVRSFRTFKKSLNTSGPKRSTYQYLVTQSKTRLKVVVPVKSDQNEA